jgi:hypothetical protein
VDADPPYEHVSWREEVRHDADEDLAVLADVVMRDEQPPRRPLTPYLRTVAEYPAWTVTLRMLAGALIVAIPVFLYGAYRYDYVGGESRHHFLRGLPILRGTLLTLMFVPLGLALGALWGALLVRRARRFVETEGV